METQKCTRCKKDQTLDNFKKDGLSYTTCAICRTTSAEKRKARAKQQEQQPKPASKPEAAPLPTITPPQLPDSKTCKNCAVIKPIDQFFSRATHLKGVCDRCLECRDKMVQYKRQHADEIKERRKTYLEETKEHVKERYRKYCENNREKFCQYQANYRESKPEFRIRSSQCGRLNELLKHKSYSTKMYLGVPITIVRSWLEFNFTENINWENHGKYWHIDHVIPCKLWNLLNEQEAMYCFSWMNIIPKERGRNIGKQHKLVPHEVIRQEFTVKKFAAEKHPEIIPSINDYFKAYAIKFKSLLRQHLQIVRETP